MKSLSFFFLGLTLVSCTANNREKESNPIQRVSLRDFTFKSDETLIKTKYEYASLKCSLWLKKGEKLDRTKDKPVIVEWDFKNSFDVKKELKLEKKLDNYQAEYSISITDLYISDVNFSLDDKDYRRDMSPVIELDYKYHSSAQYDNDATFKGSGAGDALLYENIKTPVMSSSGFSRRAPSVFYTNEMDCEISAKIKDQYEAEFPESKKL